MPRYFLEVAYKGTAYKGFQAQQNATTIQGEVEKALQIIFNKHFQLTGASRTDAGVHALQNFFHFDSDNAIERAQLYNINAVLPADITLKNIFQVADNAHSRFQAISREYKYYIYQHKDPFLNDRAYYYPFKLDISLLQQAACIITQHNDFTSFSKRKTQVKTFHCNIINSVWQAEDECFVYTISANRFLRGMVRGLAGTMLKVGRGVITVTEFDNLIKSGDSSRVDFSTPSQGLFLTEVKYPAAIY